MKRGYFVERKLLLLLCLFVNCSLFSQHVSFVSKAQKLCVNETVEFTNTSVGLPSDAVMEWTVVSGVSATAKLSQTETFSKLVTSSGWIRVSLRALASNGTEIARYVNDTAVYVYAPPLLKIHPSTHNTCSGLPVDFTATKLSGDGSITKYVWMLESDDEKEVSYDAKRSHSFELPAGNSYTYRVSVKGVSEFNCLSQEVKDDSVFVYNPDIRPDIKSSISAICGESGAQDVLFELDDTTNSYRISSRKWIVDGSVVGTGEKLSYRVSKPTRMELHAFTATGCEYVGYRFVSVYSLESGITVKDAIPEDTIKRYWPTKSKYCPGSEITLSADNYGKTFSKAHWIVTHKATNTVIKDTIAPKISIASLSPGIYSAALFVSTAACKGERQITKEFEVEPYSVTQKAFHHSCDGKVNIKLTALPDANSKFYWTPEIKHFARLQTSIEGNYGITSQVLFPVPISSNGCVGKSDSVEIVVEKPIASMWNSEQITGCVPVDVKFKSTSEYNAPRSKDYITQYVWFFGDGKTKVMTSNDTLVYTYSKAGNYSQRLAVVSRDGCTDTTARPDYCGFVHVGEKPRFVGNIDRDTVCAREYFTLDFEKSELVDSITGVLVNFVNGDHIVTQGSIPVDCRKVGKKNTIVHFRNADTVGDYNLNVQLEYNGCYSDVVSTPKAIHVKGPILALKKDMNCQTPYKYDITLNKRILADTWKWEIARYMSDKSVMPLDERTASTDTLMKIDFDSTTFSIDNSVQFKQSGNYRIKVSASNASQVVDNNVCYFDTSISVTVRNVKAQISVANKDGIRDNGICWKDKLGFALGAQARDLEEVDFWYAWDNNHIDSIKNHNFYSNGQSISFDYKHDKSVFDSLNPKVDNFFKDTLNVFSQKMRDSSKIAVYFKFHTNNEKSCPDSTLLIVSTYRPNPGFIANTKNICVSNAKPFTVELVDTSRIKYVSGSTRKHRLWILDTVYFRRPSDTTLRDTIINFVVDNIRNSVYRQTYRKLTNITDFLALPPFDASAYTKSEQKYIVYKTNPSDSMFIKEFYEPRLYFPKLVIQDEVGCVDELTTKSKISPWVPDIRFLGPTHICLGKDTSAAVGKFYMPLSPDTLYRTKLKKVQWSIYDTTTVNIKPEEVAEASKPAIFIWNSPSTKDTVRYSFRYTNENIPICIESWSIAPNGQECYNVDTVRRYSVRSVKSSIKVLEKNKVSCTPGEIKMYPIVGWTFEWQKYVQKTGKKAVITSKDNIVQFYDGEEGIDSLILLISTDHTGCESVRRSYPVYVLSNNLKNHDLVSDASTNICFGDTLGFRWTDGASADGYKYIWDFGDGAVDSSTSSLASVHIFNRLNDLSGKYMVKYQLRTSDVLCNYIDSVPVNVHNLVPNFDRGENDALLSGCIPFTVPFINKSYSNGLYSSAWNFGDGSDISLEENPSHTFTEHNKTYTVTLIISDESCKLPIEKTVRTKIHPQVIIQQSNLICEGLSDTLKVTATYTQQMWWDNNSALDPATPNYKQVIHPQENTDLYLNTVSHEGCARRDTVHVRVQNRPVYNGAPVRPLVYIHHPNDTLTDYVLKQYELLPYVYYNLNNDSIPGISYLWKPSTGLNCSNCASPTVMLANDENYTLTMTDPYGCFTETANVKLSVIKETKLALPSAFTPNGDGDNDRAWVRGWGIKQFIDVRIYNRWGQLVYESSNIEDGWDGTYNGVAQNTETFAYIIRAKNNKDEAIAQKGYITLLR